jgi:YD repeat-containing protein
MWLEFKLSLVFILPNLIAYPSNIGKIVKQTDANDHTTTSVYDLQGHLTDSYDALGTSPVTPVGWALPTINPLRSNNFGLFSRSTWLNRSLLI